MRRKCDKCNRPATYHSVEIQKGQKIEMHLCDLHTAEAGLAGKGSHENISQLLTNFVKLQTGGVGLATTDVRCEECGLTFSKFREQSLLGCPSCYKAFEGPLSPLLERAHEGGTHHVGKAPRRAGTGEHRQLLLGRLRRRLDEAVAAEDYELAARLRDDIRRHEEAEA